MFVIPKVIEGFWDFFEKMKLINSFESNKCLLFSIAISIFLFLKIEHTESLSSTNLKILKIIFD